MGEVAERMLKEAATTQARFDRILEFIRYPNYITPQRPIRLVRRNSPDSGMKVSGKVKMIADFWLAPPPHTDARVARP